MSWIFGILGAAAAVVYSISTGKLSWPLRMADRSSWAPELLIYAAVGFVVGLAVGIAIKAMRSDY